MCWSIMGIMSRRWGLVTMGSCDRDRDEGCGEGRADAVWIMVAVK
jgi:hypothetical protein